MGDVQTKDAAIRPTGPDDAFPGTFDVILSAPTKDRDGDTLLAEDWKQPLPEHITFDQDHLMSVAGTVGSGKPEIDPATGNLIVHGTYSSLQRAQEVRTLVKEGHIRTTSVAFMSEKATEKDGKTRTVRELLNGAFVAVPSNREALVLAAKDIKESRRNSATDMNRIQAIHDHTIALGATPAAVDGKEAKAPLAPMGTVTAPVDPPVPPTIPDQVNALLSNLDAAFDTVLGALGGVATDSLPDPVQQAVAVITEADQTLDQVLVLLGVPDPDEPLSSAAANSAAAPRGTAARSAAADLQTKYRVLQTITDLGEKST